MAAFYSIIAFFSSIVAFAELGELAFLQYLFLSAATKDITLTIVLIILFSLAHRNPVLRIVTVSFYGCQAFNEVYDFLLTLNIYNILLFMFYSAGLWCGTNITPSQKTQENSQSR